MGHLEYRIRRDDAELEITGEHERCLQWMLENGIQHVRIE